MFPAPVEQPRFGPAVDAPPASHDDRHATTRHSNAVQGAIDNALTQYMSAGASYLSAGSAGATELERDHLAQVWRLTDEAEVARQVTAFKEHAMQVLYQLIRHGDARGGKLTELQRAVGDKLGLEDEAMLKQAVQATFAAAEAAVKRLHKHEEGELRLAPSEYAELLQSLDASMVKTVAFIRHVACRCWTTCGGGVGMCVSFCWWGRRTWV